MSGKRNFRGQVEDEDGEVIFGSGDRFRGGMRRGRLEGFGQYTHVEGEGVLCLVYCELHFLYRYWTLSHILHLHIL